MSTIFKGGDIFREFSSSRGIKKYPRYSRCIVRGFGIRGNGRGGYGRRGDVPDTFNLCNNLCNRLSQIKGVFLNSSKIENF